MHKKQLGIRVMLFAMILSLGLFTASTIAQDTPTPSGYVGLQNTEIRGISEEDIAGYRSGAGLGFALPAELNGYPGPRHVLELSDEIALTETQNEQIQTLYDTMLPQAVALGEEILREEAALELAFRNEFITDDYLSSQLSIIGTLRADLRYVHLRTHLATIDILTQHQIRQYNDLRGYESSNESGESDHEHSGQH
jgi:hypothetical protein